LGHQASGDQVADAPLGSRHSSRINGVRPNARPWRITGQLSNWWRPYVLAVCTSSTRRIDCMQRVRTDADERTHGRRKKTSRPANEHKNTEDAQSVRAVLSSPQPYTLPARLRSVLRLGRPKSEATSQTGRRRKRNKYERERWGRASIPFDCHQRHQSLSMHASPPAWRWMGTRSTRKKIESPNTPARWANVELQPSRLHGKRTLPAAPPRGRLKAPRVPAARPLSPRAPRSGGADVDRRRSGSRDGSTLPIRESVKVTGGVNNCDGSCLGGESRRGMLPAPERGGNPNNRGSDRPMPPG